MRYVDETHIMDKYSSKAFDMYFGGCKICVLDIETTGLAPGSSHFVLGSLLSFEENDEVRLRQYFAEDIYEEKQLLAEYAEEAKKYDVLLTYNGRHFDTPFLLSRADKLELDIFDMPYNLDLYLVLNGHSSLRKLLPNLKQKTVEDFMGLWYCRSDKISGAESARLYMEYLYLKEIYEDAGRCVELMLLHNRDDVLQLGKLLPVIEKTDFHKAMYALGFPVIANGRKLFVEKIRFDGNCLKAAGTQAAGQNGSSPVDFISYGDGMSGCAAQFEKNHSAFEISFPIIKKSGLAIMDLQNLPFDICGELSGFPNFESGYLVLKNKDDVKYAEANCFIKAYLLKMLETFD